MVYHVLGLMSGTSLDGLDLAFCRFEKVDGKYLFSIIQADCIDYQPDLRGRLKNANHYTATELVSFDFELGHFFGEAARDFCFKYKITPDFIASHGHTIFHQPDKGFTLQIGKGAAIAAQTECSVVCDFRSTDVTLGGQGAPLVPIGDQLLFPDYDYCLNLGGFANVSFQQDDKRIAYDICPVNIVLNELSKQLGFEYDRGGSLAKQGIILDHLLERFNDHEFYKKPGPKSLGREWVESEILPHLKHYDARDLLRTYSEHIAIQISKSLNQQGRVLVTGGGAFNNFLMDRIRLHCYSEIIVPDDNVVKYKEALIFAFLGLLRWLGVNNSLRSVTGARRDSIGGAIYY